MERRKFLENTCPTVTFAFFGISFIQACSKSDDSISSYTSNTNNISSQTNTTNLKFHAVVLQKPHFGCENKFGRGKVVTRFQPQVGTPKPKNSSNNHGIYNTNTQKIQSSTLPFDTCKSPILDSNKSLSATK